MAIKGSARRYARAIFELSKEDRIVEWQTDMSNIVNIFKDEIITAYLENPSIHFEDKTMLLQGKLGDIDQIVLNLVYVLINKSRLDMLQDIANEYKKLVDNYQGIERVVVTTALPLDDEARANILRETGRLIDKKIIMETEYVDPNLIGGVVIKVAGKLLDGSTRNKLAALKNEMS